MKLLFFNAVITKSLMVLKNNSNACVWLGTLIILLHIPHFLFRCLKNSFAKFSLLNLCSESQVFSKTFFHHLFFYYTFLLKITKLPQHRFTLKPSRDSYCCDIEWVKKLQWFCVTWQKKTTYSKDRELKLQVEIPSFTGSMTFN